MRPLSGHSSSSEWRVKFPWWRKSVTRTLNSASNLASRAVCKNQISLEGLTPAIYLINRCHHFLKSQQDLFMNKQTWCIKSAKRQMVKRKDILRMSLVLLSNPPWNITAQYQQSYGWTTQHKFSLYMASEFGVDSFWIASLDNLVLISLEWLHAKLYPFRHCLFGKRICCKIVIFSWFGALTR